jgi:hypothetical protein
MLAEVDQVQNIICGRINNVENEKIAELNARTTLHDIILTLLQQPGTR